MKKKPALGPSRALRAKYQAITFISVATSLAIYSVVATQLAAAHFSYDPALGAPGAFGLYTPSDWLIWSFQFYSYGSSFFAWLYVAFIVVFMITTIVGVVVTALKTRSAIVYDDIHGSAQFLKSPDELRAVKWLPPAKPGPDDAESSGPYLAGCLDENGRIHYLRAIGNDHIGIIAPTRSGKGIGPIVMTLVTWTDALVTFDPKGENFHLTAGWRRTLGKVYRWNPLGGENYNSFNFLSTVRIFEKSAADDAMDIASALVDPSAVGDWDHWQKTGFRFLAGLILHVMYKKHAELGAGQSASLADLAYSLNDPDTPSNLLYQQMRNNLHGEFVEGKFRKGIRNEAVAMAGQAQINREDREKTSVHSTCAAAVDLYTSHVVRENTSRSDFKITDIFNSEAPGSLYISVSPSKELKLQPMLKMMIALIIRTLTERELAFVNSKEVMPWRHRTLMLLDEFASLGPMKEIELSLSRIAGYGVRYMLAIQDINQLLGSYSQYQTILGGLATKVIYAPNDTNTAAWLSELLGTATVSTTDISESGNRFGGPLDHVNFSYGKGSRPLLTPDECRRIKAPVKDRNGKITEAGDVIVTRTGLDPVYGRQIMYFENPFFAERVALPAPDDLGKTPRSQLPLADAAE